MSLTPMKIFAAAAAVVFVTASGAMADVPGGENPSMADACADVRSYTQLGPCLSTFEGLLATMTEEAGAARASLPDEQRTLVLAASDSVFSFPACVGALARADAYERLYDRVLMDAFFQEEAVTDDDRLLLVDFLRAVVDCNKEQALRIDTVVPAYRHMTDKYRDVITDISRAADRLSPAV